MEILLNLIILLLLVFSFCYVDVLVSEVKKVKKQCNSLKKQCNRLRFEVMKLQDNEFYIFDYITGMYEDIERGNYEEGKES